MPSNLPPGCTSDDGGLDHALETAIEELVMDIDGIDQVEALKFCLPGIKQSLKATAARRVRMCNVIANTAEKVIAEHFGGCFAQPAPENVDDCINRGPDCACRALCDLIAIQAVDELEGKE